MKIKCIKCKQDAIWIYLPDHDKSYCDDCVERGCSCNNENEMDDKGRLFPCIEYEYWQDGYDSERLDLLFAAISSIPDDWEYLYTDEYSYDGADITMPFFVRKDKRAIIYINDETHDSDCMFGISFTFENDGDCAASFAEALLICENYKYEDKS
jgi:hypothetical protein